MVGVRVKQQAKLLWMKARHNNPQAFASLDRATQNALTFLDEHRSSVSLSVFGAGMVSLLGVSLAAFQPQTSTTLHSDETLGGQSIASGIVERLEADKLESVVTAENKTIDDLLNLEQLGKVDDDADRQRVADISEPPIAEEPAAPTREEKSVTVKSGDTLMDVLVKAGVPRSQAFSAIKTMTPKLNPRRIRAGQVVNLTMQIAPEGEVVLAEGEEETPFKPALVGMMLKTDVDKHLHITRENAATDKFSADEEVIALTEAFKRARGTINSSLFLAADELDIPSSVIVEMMRMYSYDVDFQREIRQGDQFEVFYSQMVDGEGNIVKSGNVYYGNLVLRGKENPYYRYTTPDDGIADYYNEKGQSAKKFLMKTPVDGARLSSSFGRRKHPVLGYTKMHKGTDFAAPRGTPIKAAGNGTVERANRFGTFGNYIKIRHANGYKTAYAHLKGFAKGIRKGARVKQGQIIGYIGTTGRSTGPHLHYEVHLNGKQVNPMTIRVPTGRKLEGDMLAKYKTMRAKMQTRMAEIPVTTKLTTAQLDTSE